MIIFAKVYWDPKKKNWQLLRQSLRIFILHNQAFQSMDCTSKLIGTLFESKFICAHTKTEAIIKNLFTPYTINIFLKTLKNINFITLFTNASQTIRKINYFHH